MEEASLLVTKAKTALHSAAAKAERVLTDLKSDLTPHHRPPDTHGQFESQSPEFALHHSQGDNIHESKHLSWRPSQKVTKHDWHDRLKNIGIGRKGVKDIDKIDNSLIPISFFDENAYEMSIQNVFESKGSEISSSTECLNGRTDIIPCGSIMRQLAMAAETGKKLSMKDFMASSGDISPLRERASLSLSSMMSLVLREKEEKLLSEFGNDETIQTLIHTLFVSEGQFSRKKINSDLETFTCVTSLPRDIHGTPPEGFVVRLAKVIGNFKTLRKMALFWCNVVVEQLQVINCCISRKRRRIIATESLDYVLKETESLDSVLKEPNLNVEELDVSLGTMPATPILYARLSSGELVLRLGADRLCENLKLLETAEPVYSPVTQEIPLLTEDLIKETEEFVLRTGSVGAGCSQLLSDMQAFKAANPGCILEDFVRWHSPPDWSESEPCNEAKNVINVDDLSSARGQLSSRMQKEGNLWRELWETSKPVPAVKQTPLYDEDLAVEHILNDLQEIQPSVLFEQLFVSLLGLGLIAVEPMVSADNALSKLFYECKDYVVANCQTNILNQKIDDLCQVYETVEMMLINPCNLLKSIKQSEEVACEPKSRFRRLSLNFGKDKLLRKSTSKDQNIPEDNPTRQPFASFFDGKSSLFSKKPPKPETTVPIVVDTLSSTDGDWTVV